MTPTPEQLKELAKFAVEFLGGVFHKKWRMDDFLGTNAINVWVFPAEINDATTELYFNDSDLEEFFFHWNGMAPILMHLGKREMEKRELKIRYESNWKYNPYHEFEVFGLRSHSDGSGDIVSTLLATRQHKNEFIAFWSAVEKAAGGGE